MNIRLIKGCVFVGIIITSFAITYIVKTKNERKPKANVTLEPSFLEWDQDVVAGDLVEVPMSVQNKTASPIILEEYTTTCGCTEVTLASGDTLPHQSQIVIDAGKRLPLFIKIHPTASVEAITKKWFQILLRCKSDSGNLQLFSKIAINVRRGPSLEPSRVMFPPAVPGKQGESEVAIVDALPDPGFQIARIESSDPDHFWATWEQAENHSSNKNSEIKTRYRLKVHCLYAEVIPAKLTIIPVSDKHPQLLLDVDCQLPSPDYSLRPSTLVVFGLQTGENFSRDVYCTIGENATEPLEVLEAPDFLSVDVESLQKDVKVIHIRGKVPNNAVILSKEKPFLVVFGDKKTGVTKFNIPVLFSL